MVSSNIILLLLLAPAHAFVAPLAGPRLLSPSRSSQQHVNRFMSLKRADEEQDTMNLDKAIKEEADSFDPFLNGEVATTDSVGELVEEEEQAMSLWVARGLLLIVAMLWGTNFAAVKYLETLCFHPPCNHPPSEAALARFGVAALVSIPLLIGKRKDVILGGLECGLWITMGYITQAMALETISSGKCAFICSLAVVVVPLLSALAGKPIKAVNVASAVVALTGVGVLEGMIDVSSLTGIQPALAEVTTSVAGIQPALAEVATSVVQSVSAVDSSSITEAAAAGGPLAAMAGALGVSKGDILALGQPIGFGLSFMRIEHYVEKFEDVENRIQTIAAAECVMAGFCSLLWVLYDFHGTIPDFGYMVSCFSEKCDLHLRTCLGANLVFVSTKDGLASVGRRSMDWYHDNCRGDLYGRLRFASGVSG